MDTLSAGMIAGLIVFFVLGIMAWSTLLTLVVSGSPGLLRKNTLVLILSPLASAGTTWLFYRIQAGL